MSINTDQTFNINTIPLDVYPLILKNLSKEMDTVALVCKTWKEIVDSETFREMICPEVMGIKQLIMHKPNIIFKGKEHPLPRKFYREYAMKEEREKGLCFFNPGTVELKMVNGEHKSVVLNSFEAIASVFSDPNLKACFTSDSCQAALKEIRKEEAPHWVWEAEACGSFSLMHKSYYEQQQKMVEEQDKALYPERYQAIGSKDKPKANKPKIVTMSNGNDHVLGKFMEEAILRKRKVMWNRTSGDIELIRVKDTIKDGNMDAQVFVAVAPSGLFVTTDCSETFPWNTPFSFVCARKSFAT